MSISDELIERKHTLFTSTVSGDKNGDVYILGEKLDVLAERESFATIVGSMLLGKKLKSKKTEQFIDLALRLLVDHGPYVSGAVNTMIAARAGKDLVSSLCAGLLTIGSRFGGAINQSAAIWFDSVSASTTPNELVETYAKRKQYIPGIGHKKYRIDMPDPRVALLKKALEGVTPLLHLDFAIAVERITVVKKSNLILNVDGTIAAAMLDLLLVEEKLDTDTIKSLIHSEFFNALFVLSRSVGFVAHYLDQKRLGEGLFRLPEDEVFVPR